MQKRDFETYQKRFRDFEILLKFSETYIFQGTIRHPYMETSIHSNTMNFISYMTALCSFIHLLAYSYQLLSGGEFLF